MADQTTEDIEFIPSDEIAEAEPDDTEHGAVHRRAVPQPGRGSSARWRA
jgi:hypothetical protein